MGILKSLAEGIGSVFQDPSLKDCADSAESLLRCITRKDVGDRKELELMRLTLQKDYPDSYGHFINQMEVNRLAPQKERESFEIKNEIKEIRKIVESLLESQEEVPPTEVSRLQDRLSELTEKLEIVNEPKKLVSGSDPRQKKNSHNDRVNDFFAAYGK